MGLFIKSAKVPAKDDGYFDLVGEDGADDFTEVGGAGGGEEEDAKGGEWVGGGDFGEVFKAGADGEACDVDFLGRDFLGEEGFLGVMIGDEKVIAGGARPCGVDFDGVGDDGDDGNVRGGGEEALDHVGVEGVGVDDDVGLECFEEVCDGVFGLCDEGKGLGEVLLVGGAIDPRPDAGGVGGDLAVGAADDAVDAGVAEMAGVGHENLGPAV